MILLRAAPWILSLAAHVGIVLLVPLGAELAGMRTPVVERRVVLQLDDEPPEAPPAPPAAAPSIAAAAIRMPSSIPLPEAPALDPVAEELRAASTRGTTVPGGVPGAREVLAAIPPASAEPAVAAARAEAVGQPMARIDWTGAARTVVRSPNPRFPAILSETGQEAEVVARITVTPLGAVIDVEITRGSGYTEIDAAVETALRQWIFSRSEGKQNAVGTVSYRFPLEKRD